MDAELDDAHRRHLGIGFDTLDLPAEQFLTANEAWKRIRESGDAPELFGHGDASGGWFVLVNLARDYLALQGGITSAWDDWRIAFPRGDDLDASSVALSDRLAELIDKLERNLLRDHVLPDLEPFWINQLDERLPR